MLKPFAVICNIDELEPSSAFTEVGATNDQTNADSQDDEKRQLSCADLVNKRVEERGAVFLPNGIKAVDC